MTVTSETPPASPSPPGGNGRPQRRRQQSALANPVLIGAVTVLAILLAVFLAYNANNGLPFVPTRELNVDIASGSDLVPGDEVREGGFRIGLVSAMEPTVLTSGQVAANLTLKLDQAHGKVPINSTAAIRPRSVLGLKYVNLHYGTSHKTFADGGTMPITQTSVPVQFEDLNQMFDTKTRTRDPGQPGRLWQRARRSWLGAQRHDRDPAAAAALPQAGGAVSGRAEHRANALLAVARGLHAARWRRWRQVAAELFAEDGDHVRRDLAMIPPRSRPRSVSRRRRST